MKRDDAIALVEYFAKDVKLAGTRTAPYHGYNAWTAFVVRDTPYTYDSAQTWTVPGLFIAYSDLQAANRPYLTVFYKMSCGKVLVLVLPIVVVEYEGGSSYKLPNNLAVLKRGGILKGQPGFWVALEQWHLVGNSNELVLKKGAKKRAHLAKKAGA